jgi:endonuclease YncB( thermonuclease family)
MERNSQGSHSAKRQRNTLQGLYKTVEIKSYGPDRYGRTLAEVFVDRLNVNIEMLKAGYAEVYRGGYPAPGLNIKPYWEAEEAAAKAKRGM